jgi:hypothetical protein
VKCIAYILDGLLVSTLRSNGCTDKGGVVDACRKVEKSAASKK